MKHTTEKPAARWPRRLGWLLLIWLASVLALGVVAGLLRLVMRSIGMSH